jgi:hypothetical protein
MMTYVGVKIQIFIALAQDGGERQLPVSAASLPEKKITRWLGIYKQCGEDRNLAPVSGTQPRSLGCPASSLVAIQTAITATNRN